MGVSDMDTVENKGFNVTEHGTVNEPNGSALVRVNVNSQNPIESNAVQILRNKEKETEERLEKSPLHLSLRELSIV